MSMLELISSKSFEERFIKPVSFHSKKVAYGTAGFRTKASDLDWVMYRMGLLSCFRSISQDCKFIGCMITASHNPQEDNGCKLVDPYGDMLEEEWESYATELVNSNNLKETLLHLSQTKFKSFLDKYEQEQSVSEMGRIKKANIVVAYDTRPSSPLLFEAFKTGVEDLNAILINYGLLTTPQLHYMVRCLNTNGQYGEPNEEGYFNKLSKAFFNIWAMIDFKDSAKYETDLYLDGANGIGAHKMRTLAKLFTSTPLAVDNNANIQHHQQQPCLNINLFNECKNSNDILNHLCGADHVKVLQTTPINLPTFADNKIRKYCSFDGDADRIVYYYLDREKRFHLLDGDKISTLVATYLKELTENAQLSSQLTLCIVQTAYANGNSTNFIENIMKVNVSCVPTGVKHLHHEAQKYDIGVYFEANGHGTILFSEKAENLIEEKYKSLIQSLQYSEESNEFRKCLKEDKHLSALYFLKHLKDCINQTVGDAISDLLVVELILAMKGLSVADWDLLYIDLPSRQLKVTIQDRSKIKTTDAERRVCEPIELQNRLDELIKSSGINKARAFVRPSGTEDVVRVYAEADTQENTDKLAKQVAQLVYDLAGGVGNRPN